MTAGKPVTGPQTAGRHVLRIEEVLPCPKEGVWQALTDPDLIARWLMPNDFKLEVGHRFAIDSDPIRQCGLGGTGHCEVLAFDEGKCCGSPEVCDLARVGLGRLSSEGQTDRQLYHSANRSLRRATNSSTDSAGRPVIFPTVSVTRS